MRRTEEQGRRVVRAEEILAKIEQGEPVEYEGFTIKQGLDLRTLKRDEDGKYLVSSRIRITNSDIQGLVNFEDVVFKEPICFDGSTFHSAKFQGAKFCKYAGFEDTVFCLYGQFSHAHFMGDASFTNIRFKGLHAMFDEAKFEGDTFFWSLRDGGTIFDCEAYFNYAKFNKNVTFKGAEFANKADFQLTHFNGEHVQFVGVNFKDESDFKGAQFKGKALFRKATFYGLANFQLANFNEDAYFQDIVFIEGAQANFTETKFAGDALFVRSSFSDSVTFTSTRFNGYLDFAYANFNKNLNLDLTKIHKMRFRAELGNNSNISLKDADFDLITNIRWNDIKDHLDYGKNGRSIYLSLVRSFKSLGYFDDADDCYYVCRNEMKNEKSKSNWSKMYDILSYVSCGYGVRPGYTIGWILVAMYVFWVIFL